MKSASAPGSKTASSSPHAQRVSHALQRLGVNAYLVPSADEFQGEYTPASAKRLTWVSGFTGSAGQAVILSKPTAQKKLAALFTDGRYTLQAPSELDMKLWDVHNTAQTPLHTWLAVTLKRGATVGFDPMLHSYSQIDKLSDNLESYGITLKSVVNNPVDALWHDRPAPPTALATPHPDRFAGETIKSKFSRLQQDLKKKHADALIVFLPESLCWLLNVRGGDVPYTPFVLSYGIFYSEGRLDWFVDEKKITPAIRQHVGNRVTIKGMKELQASLSRLKGKQVIADSTSCAYGFIETLSHTDARLIDLPDPILLMKAQKNQVELRGSRAAHTRDGLAVCQFLHWLDTTLAKRRITEIEASDKLKEFRKSHKLFRDLSFDTIAGSGPNGAIVHYHATEASNRTLYKKDGLFLLDSGGQYPDGTTDITRTLPIGPVSAEHKDRFTRVLKGHIALASAVFPVGTTGSQLDALARHALWQEGLDYDHGTGHGVGSYLSVHEGPQRISKRGGDVPLLPGMIVSNEPGYYKNGAYGIRIENLVAVKEIKRAGKPVFYGFETLTLVPIDTRLIAKKLLTEQEKNWLNQYHATVLKAHLSALSPAAQRWLKARCKPI